MVELSIDTGSLFLITGALEVDQIIHYPAIPETLYLALH